MGEYGVESDQTSQVFPIVMGKPAIFPITVAANLNKINLAYGVYLQDTWQITDKLSVNFGSRWDRVTGFTINSQFSPTINFVYKPRADTVFHAGLRAKLSTAQLSECFLGHLQTLRRHDGRGGYQPDW